MPSILYPRNELDYAVQEVFMLLFLIGPDTLLIRSLSRLCYLRPTLSISTN